MHLRSKSFTVRLGDEVKALLDTAANSRNITPAAALGQAIDRFDPSGIIDTNRGTGPLQSRTFTLTAAQVLRALDNTAHACLGEESAAIVAAIRQFAAAQPCDNALAACRLPGAG